MVPRCVVSAAGDAVRFEHWTLLHADESSITRAHVSDLVVNCALCVANSGDTIHGRVLDVAGAWQWGSELPVFSVLGLRYFSRDFVSQLLLRLAATRQGFATD